MKFTTFKFGVKLQEGLDMMGFEDATPVQQQAIPIIQSNKDLIAVHKQVQEKPAFVLPILDKLSRTKQNNKVNTIILSPTRELAYKLINKLRGSLISQILLPMLLWGWNRHRI